MKRPVGVPGVLLAACAVAVPAGFAADGVKTGGPTTPKPGSSFEFAATASAAGSGPR